MEGWMVDRFGGSSAFFAVRRRTFVDIKAELSTNFIHKLKKGFRFSRVLLRVTDVTARTFLCGSETSQRL